MICICFEANKSKSKRKSEAIGNNINIEIKKCVPCGIVFQRKRKRMPRHLTVGASSTAMKWRWVVGEDSNNM